jgi:hypothetical protein
MKFSPVSSVFTRDGTEKEERILRPEQEEVIRRETEKSEYKSKSATTMV